MGVHSEFEEWWCVKLRLTYVAEPLIYPDRNRIFIFENRKTDSGIICLIFRWLSQQATMPGEFSFASFQVQSHIDTGLESDFDGKKEIRLPMKHFRDIQRMIESNYRCISRQQHKTPASGRGFIDCGVGDFFMPRSSSSVPLW